MPFTEQEARDMIAAIENVRQIDAAAAKATKDAALAIAQAWFDALPQIIDPTVTKDDAASNYREIQTLQRTERDADRQEILRRELVIANDDFLLKKRTLR